MSHTIRRARPLLGTVVDIRVEGLPEDDAIRAIDAAFIQIEQIHHCMSFHEPDSDLSRLHRTAVGGVVAVDTRTNAVIACALRVAHASGGVFDPTIAAHQVAGGFLPRPPSSFDPDPHARWHDIELIDATHVRLRRPLWIDLGGIAKGFTVDRAMHVLVAAGAAQACVNAGGDIRVHGARAEPVHVRLRNGTLAQVLEITNAAVATSGLNTSPHLDGVSRALVSRFESASVVAPECMIADALTKVVLGDCANVADVLAAFDASACVHDDADGWRTVGRAA